MIKRIPIRVKLAAALAVPLLLVVSVAYVEIANATRNVGDVKDETALATTTVGPGGLILALQNERNDAATKILGQRELLDLSVKDTGDARQQTDTSLKQFRRALDGRDPTAIAAYTEAFRELDRLAEIRKIVDDVDGPETLKNVNVAATVFSQYSAVIIPLLDANAAVRLSINDAELRNGAELLDQVSRLTEAVARLNREVTFQILSGGLTDTARAVVVADLVADYDAHMEGIRVEAQGPYRRIGQAIVQGKEYRAYRGLLGDYLQDREVDPTELVTVPAATPSGRTYDALRQSASDTVVDRANALRSEALDRQRTFVGFALLGLVLALVVTTLAARSITRPLRSLTNQTDEMATRRLPDAVQAILDTPLGEDVQMPEVPPIRVRTRDEVADVAEALNTVQLRTLDLAVEQAVLRRNISDSFVNLGRRTQNLIGRQLDFITSLEHEENDPDVLENLFKLDHLATRVRRNAESLVVLAGLDNVRQWSAPVSMGDLIRSTIGEVEEFQRVVVRRVDPARMPGSAATDLIHLLAELVENGLSFSPPDRDVEVAGHMSADGYVLSVVDHGLGMHDEDLERSNKRLAGEESFTIAPSRYLGHYVAGHLAARLGVDVVLSPTPSGGITATVSIPVEALSTEELAETDAPDPAVTGRVEAPHRSVTVGQPAAVVAPAGLAHSNGARRSDGAPPAAPIRRQNPRPVEQAVGHSAAAPVEARRRAFERLPAPSPPPAPVRSRIPAPMRPTPEPASVPKVRPYTSAPPAPAAPAAPTPAPPAPAAPAPSGPSAPPFEPVPFPAAPDRTPANAPTSFPPTGPTRQRPADPAEARPLAPTARSNGSADGPALHRKREAAPSGGTTPNGLRKRVKGGQMPNQGGLLVNRRAPTPGPAPVAARQPVVTEAPAPAPVASSSADNVFDFLSSFEAGVQRGREEASQADDDPTAPFETRPTDGN